MATVLALEWTRTAIGNDGSVVLSGSSLLPSAVDTEYTASFQVPGVGRAARNISIVVTATAVSGTNVDVALYGSNTSEAVLARTDDGAKFLLLDAVVADLTKAGSVYTCGGVVNCSTYPAPYYHIGLTTDADEKANTVTVYVFIPGLPPDAGN